MAGAEDNADQSMEEILQSIKRIIADEDDEPQKTAEEAAEGTDDDTGSVLELTELVQDDDQTSDAASEESHEEAASFPGPESPAPTETLSDMLADTDMEESTHDSEEVLMLDSDSLISESVAQATSSALHSLRHQPRHAAASGPTPSPAFRSGYTVEDLMMEALRPMLKEWLDANLQTIVEKTVEREVRRLSDN